MIKTVIFLIIIIIVITKLNSHYRNLYNNVFQISENYIKSFLKTNPLFLYIYVPVLFFLASKVSLFEYANGYYVSHIKKMLLSVNKQSDKYNQPKPFIDELTIISIVVFSLISTISGSSLGSEAVMIYLSISLINYLYFSCKKLFNLDNINTEILIYTGYAIGFDATFTSLISTITYIFEKMFINHSNLLYSYHVIVLLLIVLLIHISIKDRNPIVVIDKIQFVYSNISNLLYIIIFSIIIGIVSFMFVSSFIFLYDTVKKNKYKDVLVVIFGLLLAFMIQTCGLFIIGTNEYVINEGFKNADTMDSSDNINVKFNYKNVIGKILNCIISLGSGLSGGMVIPSMTIGTGIGSLYSNLLTSKYFKPIQNIIPMTMPVQNIMYIGMVAFLSPMLDAPITSAVVINQISNQDFTTIPISLVSSFISYYVYKKLHK